MDEIKNRNCNYKKDDYIIMGRQNFFGNYLQIGCVRRLASYTFFSIKQVVRLNLNMGKNVFLFFKKKT